MPLALSQQQAIDLFGRLEAAAPVADWRYRGLRIWPLARFALRRVLVGDAPAPPREVARRPARRRLTGAFGFLAGGARAALGAAWTLRAAVVGGRHRALAIGDGVSLVRIGGEIWDRFCDPIADLYAEAGESCRTLERRARADRPRRRAALDVSPIARFALHAAVAAERDGGRAILPGREILTEMLADRPEAVAELDPLRLARGARAIQIAAAGLAPIFARARPAHVFVVDFYNTAGFAAILAARAAGAVPVDVQHGVIGRFNDAYAGWTRVPADGFDLLPEMFWTWNAADTESIEEWSRGCAHAHRARALGNPYLWLWAKDGAGVCAAGSAPAFAARAEKEILVTLQPLARFAPFYARLARAILTGPSSWRWLIRRHPTAAPDPDNPLETLSAPNVERARADALPLPVLLRHADAHVTAGSAATLEAAAFGVPTLIGLADTYAEYGVLHGTPLLTLVADDADPIAALRALPPRSAREERLPGRDAARAELGLR
jgi:hypothetical protein